MKVTGKTLHNLLSNPERLPTNYMTRELRAGVFPIPFKTESGELCVLHCRFGTRPEVEVEVRPYYLTVYLESETTVRFYLSNEILIGKKAADLLPKSWSYLVDTQYRETTLSNLTRFLNKVNRDVDVESLYNDFYFTQNDPEVVTSQHFRNSSPEEGFPWIETTPGVSEMVMHYLPLAKRNYDSIPVYLPNKLRVCTTPDQVLKVPGWLNIIKLGLYSPTYNGVSLISHARSVDVDTCQLRGRPLLQICADIRNDLAVDEENEALTNLRNYTYVQQFVSMITGEDHV